MVARGDQRKGGAGGLHPRDKTVGKGQGCGAQVIQVNDVPDVQSRFQCCELQDRRGADAHALDTRAGAIVTVEGEGGFVAKPAGQRGLGGFSMARGHVDEGGAAGTGV